MAKGSVHAQFESGKSFEDPPWAFYDRWIREIPLGLASTMTLTKSTESGVEQMVLSRTDAGELRIESMPSGSVRSELHEARVVAAEVASQTIRDWLPETAPTLAAETPTTGWRGGLAKGWMVVSAAAALIAAIVVGARSGSVGTFLASALLFILAWLIAAGVVALLLRTPEERALDAERGARERQEREQQEALDRKHVPLSNWRGVLMMTRALAVDAQCGCGARWTIQGSVANTIAEAQGLGNRLIRTGTKLEQTGATFTFGASGRRIAAGNEKERQQAHLASVLSLAACPRCHSISSVRLTRPNA